MNNKQAVEQVLAAEQARRVALIEEDHQQLDRLFSDDMVYVHTTGLIHDKAQYLAYARKVVRYLDVQRDQLQVRVYGDTAVMTGRQLNVMCKRGEEGCVRAEGFVTQVWVRGEDGWRIASFHGSRLAA